MKPQDVAACVAIVANHPVIGPRYGSAIKDLEIAWTRLIRSPATVKIAFYGDENPRSPIVAVGFSAFVSDQFVREIKSPPGLWVRPELARRVISGRSPILSEEQVREANSSGGINIFCWEGCFDPVQAANFELITCVMNTFVNVHLGYRFKELIGPQMESPWRLNWTLGAGTFFWDYQAGKFRTDLPEHPEDFVDRPHLLGATPALLASRQSEAGPSWVGPFFNYHPPVVFFSPSEQAMLSAALTGETDEQLARSLAAAVPTIKKMWASCYRRIAERIPDLFLDHLREDCREQRGKEKRRHLLAYLREHPEELRPVSRRRTTKRR